MPNLLTRLIMLIEWMGRGNSLPGGESAIVQEAHDRIVELEAKLASPQPAVVLPSYQADDGVKGEGYNMGLSDAKAAIEAAGIKVIWAGDSHE